MWYLVRDYGQSLVVLSDPALRKHDHPRPSTAACWTRVPRTPDKNVASILPSSSRLGVLSSSW